jgi:hypothetical protein
MAAEQQVNTEVNAEVNTEVNTEVKTKEFDLEEFENRYKDFFTELGYCYRCIKEVCVCTPVKEGATLRELYGEDAMYEHYLDPSNDLV